MGASAGAYVRVKRSNATATSAAGSHSGPASLHNDAAAHPRHPLLELWRRCCCRGSVAIGGSGVHGIRPGCPPNIAHPFPPFHSHRRHHPTGHAAPRACARRPGGRSWQQPCLSPAWRCGWRAPSRSRTTQCRCVHSGRPHPACTPRAQPSPSPTRPRSFAQLPRMPPPLPPVRLAASRARAQPHSQPCSAHHMRM